MEVLQSIGLEEAKLAGAIWTRGRYIDPRERRQNNPLPFPGTFTKIRAKLVPFALMADDVFVILALPEAHPRRAPNGVDALDGGGFEPGDE